MRLPGVLTGEYQFLGFHSDHRLVRRLHRRCGHREDIRRLLSGYRRRASTTWKKVAQQIRDEICSRAVPEDLRQQTLDAYEGAAGRSASTRRGAILSDRRGPPGCRFCRPAGHLPLAHGSTGCSGAHSQVLTCASVILYRLKNNIPDDLSMAVAVQKWSIQKLPAMAITMDPATRDHVQDHHRCVVRGGRNGLFPARSRPTTCSWTKVDGACERAHRRQARGTDSRSRVRGAQGSGSGRGTPFAPLSER